MIPLDVMATSNPSLYKDFDVKNAFLCIILYYRSILINDAFYICYYTILLFLWGIKRWFQW